MLMLIKCARNLDVSRLAYAFESCSPQDSKETLVWILFIMFVFVGLFVSSVYASLYLRFTLQEFACVFFRVFILARLHV